MLAVGALSQAVSVEGTAPLLQTETPSNAVTLTSMQITELPTFGHNYLQTAILSPGVTPVASNSMLTVTVSNYFSGGTSYKPVSVSPPGAGRTFWPLSMMDLTSPIPAMEETFSNPHPKL